MDSTSDGNRPCCRVCRFHDGLYFPKPEISSLEDLRRQSQCLSFGIFKHWILLNKILKRFEAQIQKRWIKRGYDSRLSVLLQAWPDMAATHRPDFASLRKAEVYNNKLLPNRAREKEAYLWPCINREDLTQTHNLLIFLNSRGRHLPDKFVFGDQLQAHTGEHSGDTSETNKFKMSLYGHRSPKTYGQLVPRDTGDKVQQELRMDPVAGLQVLEIQERILDFLVKCCRLILHDFDCDRIDLIEAKSAPPQLVPTEPFSSVTAMAVVAPYRLPQRLDLKRLKMLISARCEEAEEHIWALREDPGYFARAMKEWSEHCPAKIPDKFGRPHEMVGKLEFWDEVATNMVFHAYSSLIFFTATDDAIGIAQEKLEGCRHKLESSCQLPREVELAFQRLDYVVDLLANEPLVDLTLGFAASPPVRYGYERLKSDNQPFFNDLKVKMGRSSTAGRVQMLFRTLLNSDQQQKHGLSNTVEEIQRLIDEQGKDSELISSWVASRFSDLALMTEVSRELSLFQPWYTAWRTRPHVEDSAPYFSRMVQCVHSVLTCANLDLANPARFPYPSDKRRTEKTVIKMRLAEKKLDQFWKVVDAHCEAHTYYSMTSLLMVRLIREAPHRSCSKSRFHRRAVSYAIISYRTMLHPLALFGYWELCLQIQGRALGGRQRILC